MMSLLTKYRLWILYWTLSGEYYITNYQPLIHLEHLLTLWLVKVPRKLLCSIATAEKTPQQVPGSDHVSSQGSSVHVWVHQPRHEHLCGDTLTHQTILTPHIWETLFRLHGEEKPECREFTRVICDPSNSGSFPWGVFRRLQPCPEHPMHGRGSRMRCSTTCPLPASPQQHRHRQNNSIFVLQKGSTVLSLFWK